MSISGFASPALWRERRPGDRTVGWLELFYDLVFVAVLIELGSGLVADVSWAGVGRFAALFTLVWWAWTGTTFHNNRIAVDDISHRLLTFVQMFGIASVGILSKEAFGDASAGFALSYAVVRLSLVVMYVRARRHVPAVERLAAPYARWFGVGALLWVASAVVPAPWRFVLWGLALLVDLAHVVTRTLRGDVAEELQPDREHMTERYALFTIIVLGESFIKTIGALADEGGTVDAVVMGAFGLAIIAALWWTYFDDVADSPIRHDLGLLGTGTWVYGHLPLTLGITATGVAVEKLATLGLDEVPPTDELLLITGSIALVLLSVAALDAVTRNRHFAVDVRHRVVSRLTAVAALGMVALLGGSLVSWALGAVVAAVVVAQIAAEVVVARRAHRQMTVQVSAEVDRAGAAELCDHLLGMGNPQPRTRGCEECLEGAGSWVQLRVCTTCGHVGCCDDSPGRHAIAHHEEEGHPTMRSAEADQQWAWCYVDELSADLTTARGRR